MTFLRIRLPYAQDVTRPVMCYGSGSDMAPPDAQALPKGTRRRRKSLLKQADRVGSQTSRSTDLLETEASNLPVKVAGKSRQADRYRDRDPKTFPSACFSGLCWYSPAVLAPGGRAAAFGYCFASKVSA